MGEEQRDQRRYPRLAVRRKSKTMGRLNGMGEASILNISLSGALIEHAEFVRLGIILDLVLPLTRGKTKVQCRVIRSAVNRQELQPDGEETLIYQTGVDFLQSTAAYGNGSCAGELDVPRLAEHIGLWVEKSGGFPATSRRKDGR